MTCWCIKTAFSAIISKQPTKLLLNNYLGQLSTCNLEQLMFDLLPLKTFLISEFIYMNNLPLEGDMGSSYPQKEVVKEELLECVIKQTVCFHGVS